MGKIIIKIDTVLPELAAVAAMHMLGPPITTVLALCGSDGFFNNNLQIHVPQRGFPYGTKTRNQRRCLYYIPCLVMIY